MIDCIETVIVTVVTVLFIAYAVGSVWVAVSNRRLEKKDGKTYNEDTK